MPYKGVSIVVTNAGSTVSGNIQEYAYSEIGDPTIRAAYGRAGGALYPTIGDAQENTNPLTVGTNTGNVDIASISLPSASTTPDVYGFSVLYDTDTLTNQPGQQISLTQIQPDGYPATPLVQVGTGVGEARNIRAATGGETTGASGSIQPVTYDSSDGAGGAATTGVAGFLVAGGGLYPTAADALANTNPITVAPIGTAAAGNAIQGTLVISTSTATGLVPTDYIVIPNAGSNGNLRRARVRALGDTTNAVVPPIWVNPETDAVLVTAPALDDLAPEYPATQLIQYAVNAAPTTPVNGYAIALPNGGFEVYSDYALTQLLTQDPAATVAAPGATGTDVIPETIEPRAQTSSSVTPIQQVTYNTSDGAGGTTATGLTAYLVNDQGYYPTVEDARAQTNQLTVAPLATAAVGNAITESITLIGSTITETDRTLTFTMDAANLVTAEVPLSTAATKVTSVIIQGVVTDFPTSSTGFPVVRPTFAIQTTPAAADYTQIQGDWLLPIVSNTSRPVQLVVSGDDILKGFTFMRLESDALFAAPFSIAITIKITEVS